MSNSDRTNIQISQKDKDKIDEMYLSERGYRPPYYVIFHELVENMEEDIASVDEMKMVA